MRRKIIFIFIIILFTTFAIKQTFFFKQTFIEDIASCISYPFLYLSNKIAGPINNFFEKKIEYKKLLSKRKKLKKKNEALLHENIKLKAFLKFAEKNNDLLDFKKRYNLENSIFANIITKNISSDEHFFLINKGSSQNIKKNMIALYKYQIIGRITDVYPWYSKVLLITDRNCKVSSYANQTSSYGICVGENNIKKCKLKYVSHLSRLVKDDYVISSGKGLIFPEGFCLGTISNFTKNELYYDVDIKPLVNLNKVTNCLITNQEKISSL